MHCDAKQVKQLDKLAAFCVDKLSECLTMAKVGMKM